MGAHECEKEVMPPRGGRECEGIKGEGECSREFDFRCFFHLARGFWNHTCNKQHVGNNPH